jgi:hypothetical protein
VNIKKGSINVCCPVSDKGEYHKLTILIPFIKIGRNTVKLKTKKYRNMDVGLSSLFP